MVLAKGGGGSAKLDATMARLSLFRGDFAWGVATSAFQIEGGREDGKGESIWDRFAATSGRMPDAGDVACDHYHRFEEDVALMAGLAVNAYRFSIAWTRVLPQGRGQINQAGLDFYRRLVDRLLAAGITPWATLYHWDLPQVLQDEGGWPARPTVDAFTEYTEVVTAALGDRVSHWITHNEPWVAAFLGHQQGVFAPGLTDWRLALAAAHHLLLSHGRAVDVIRGNVPDAVVGIALDCRPSAPASDRAEDVAAQRHFDGFRNRWFFDPVFGKGYPDDIQASYRERGRWDGTLVKVGDLETIGVPIDFLGLNYYTSVTVAAGGEEDEETGVAPGSSPPPGYTEMGWPITPAALTDYLGHLHRRYGPKRIVITENGASYSDGPGPEGTVSDQRRIDYLRDHIGAVEDALRQGVPMGGYFVWSLLDNLEWTHGFSQRFGLVWVDHATGRRIPKQSYHWYADRIRAAR
jgi:beta-glucosidase